MIARFFVDRPVFATVISLVIVLAGFVAWSALPVAEVPVGVLTMTSTVPAAWEGDTALMDVSELTVKLVAATPPNVTLAAPVKPLPVMVTLVPPAVVPLLVHAASSRRSAVAKARLTTMRDASVIRIIAVSLWSRSLAGSPGRPWAIP